MTSEKTWCEKDEYDEVQTQRDGNQFGGRWYKNKRALVEWLAAIRATPEAPTEYTHPHLFERNVSNASHYLGKPKR